MEWVLPLVVGISLLSLGVAGALAREVGDTVGDAFEGTAEPSLHVLVKLLSTITLVLAPSFI